MRKQVRVQHAQIRIEQRTLRRGAVVRFVMFQSVAADLVAERVEKVILAVVARAE